MQYSVIQMGARRKYAVPELLRRAGLLDTLYTDLCTGIGPAWIEDVGQRASQFLRLHRGYMNRRVPQVIRSRTQMFPEIVASHWLRQWASRTPAQHYAEHVRWTDQLGRKIARRGFGNATHIYSMLAECTPALTAARIHGLRVVTEVYILLSADRLVADERRAFEDWERLDREFEDYRRELRPELRVVNNSDCAICPSEAVKDDLVNVYGFPSQAAWVVPYGVEETWLSVRNQPELGRVMFGGSAVLRKGIHYFAAAARELLRSEVSYRFRVVGDVSDRIRRHPACERLEFTGRVSLDGVKSELEKADVMVLPSLAEGSAEIVYQSLAAGVPVVTTPESGSVVSSGVDGFVVPSRQEEGLANAISRIVADRNLRDSMSLQARQKALDYTWARYAERLLSVLQNV